MRRLGLLACGLAGCFSPQAPAGAPCSSTGVCPQGLACVANACVVPGTPQLDAPLVAPDASPDASSVTDSTMIDGHPAPTFTPSNGVDPHLVDPLASTIVINGAALFDADTGAISGAITRAAGTGIDGDIAYGSVAGLAVFGFAKLNVTPGGSVTFTGVRPVVFLVGDTAIINGAIDGGGGHCVGDPTCAGPGGGRGAISTATPGGCGAAHGGLTNPPDNSDSGGGGGGGGGAGADGGASGAAFAGGIGGPACLAATLEPLVGGGGGAGGGTGATMPSHGGGGGGALQITALVQLQIAGTIAMGGGGGEQGYLDPNAATSNGGGGAGGGAGGAILLESPILALAQSAILAANGGGGGGPGNANVASGMPGAPGGANATPAMGGAAAGMGTNTGGNGGAGMIAPPMVVDAGAGSNAGGGGGGVGRIFLRAMVPPPLAGLQSPPAGTGTLKP